MSTATRRSLRFLSVPAASYDQDYGLVGDVTNFVQICWHFIGPDAVLIFLVFSTVLARKPMTSRLIITFGHHHLPVAR